MTNQQAPSATVSEEDNARLKQAIPLPELQPPTPIPSATVDESISHTLQDESEGLYQGETKQVIDAIVKTENSQQEKSVKNDVDVDDSLRKIRDELTAEIYSRWLREEIDNRPFYLAHELRDRIERAVTEALAGRWRDEDVRMFAEKLLWECGVTVSNDFFEHQFAQFKSERGI